MRTTWTIGELARLAGITSRTLRHYDHLGLLTPAATGRNGYRRYGREELLRLQHLLVLRELGLPLERIGAVLDGSGDRAAALREHLVRLRSERDRLARLVTSVERTVDHLERGTTMTVEELFEGFEAKGTELEERLAAAHGEAAREPFEESRRRTAALGPAEKERVVADWAAVEDRLFALFAAGHRPGPDGGLDPELDGALAAHHAQVSRFWTPDRASYTGLGALYCDDPDFRARYDARAEGFAAFLRDSLAAWAGAHLA